MLPTNRCMKVVSFVKTGIETYMQTLAADESCDFRIKSGGTDARSPWEIILLSDRALKSLSQVQIL